MFIKSRKSLIVRFVLIFLLLGGMSGARNVQASSAGIDLSIPDPVLVTVQDTDGLPAAGLNVYAFNGTAYTGLHGVTDTNGQVSLLLAEGAYRFRADLNGTQFWSAAANHCEIPGCASASITVSKPVMLTVLDTDGFPQAGLNVYAFNGSTYTGYNKKTSADGRAVFTVPLGSYRFRADLNGTQFWSGAANHCDIPGCVSASITVSKPMTVTVLDTDGLPKAGLRVYVFNGSAYTGYNKTTDASGQATFTLPLGSYRFRADLNGTQFWSGAANHCTLPGCESVQVTVTIPLVVTIQDAGGVPKSGVNVYAFNGSAYTGYSKVSDASGQAIFTLPLGSYRFRADYLGAQYWSGVANHCSVPGCLSVAVTVGPAMTATWTATNTSTATLPPTYTPTSTFTPTPVPATLVVTTSADRGPGSLRQSIAEAAPGSTITFAPWLAGQTIILASNLVINKDLTIDGAGLALQVTISGGNVAHLEVIGLSTTTISDLTIADGYTGGNGGAIAADLTANLTLINSTLRNNHAAGDGGAVFSYGRLTLKNTTVYQNRAGSDGGAFAFVGNASGIDLINSTISQNQAGSRGGAIYMAGNAQAATYNSTYVGNAAPEGTELWLDGLAAFYLSNTFFVCVPGGSSCYVQNALAEIYEMNSVLGLGTLSDYGLAALADNGGPTETMALLPTSSLIDAGNDAMCAGPLVNNLDQRGVTRPQGAHCDIGAYEANATLEPTPTFTATATLPPTYTPTVTPTIASTPVVGCNSIAASFAGVLNPIKLSMYTMYLDIPNPNPYSVTVSSVFVTWNHDGGHRPPPRGSAQLRLQRADLNGITFWTGNVYAPSLEITPLTTIAIPPGGARLTFTFDQTYDTSEHETIQVIFSTPGCEAYPVYVMNQ